MLLSLTNQVFRINYYMKCHTPGKTFLVSEEMKASLITKSNILACSEQFVPFC